MKRNPNTEPELSRPLPVDKISAGGVEETIVADANERKLLAKRFGLLDLPKLTAKLTVTPARGETMYAVKGRIEADVVQQCVVTLEPLPAAVAPEVDVLYVAHEYLEGNGNNPHIDLEEEETEPIIGGIIDLGELVAQNLGIALDPYPRKPDIPFVEAEFGDPASGSPFAKLVDLKESPKK
jgi:uncharacterized metal-binding protein YceD (DUF177 family)